MEGGRRRYLAFDPDFAPEDAPVKFRLTYEGPLMGASRDNPRARHKHEIRKAFHPQLRRLWEIDPNLVFWTHTPPPETTGLLAGATPAAIPVWKHFAERFQRGPYKFAPLVMEDFYLVAGLDILFLRAGAAGGVINSGDLDNRLKTLFDALRMPTNADEFGGYDQPDEGEDPFFVLLTDDRLISHVSIETDTILEPSPSAQGRFPANDCRLVLTVSVTPVFCVPANLHLAG
jgi:hypothetical protein